MLSLASSECSIPWEEAVEYTIVVRRPLTATFVWLLQYYLCLYIVHVICSIYLTVVFLLSAPLGWSCSFNRGKAQCVIVDCIKVKTPKREHHHGE